MTNSPNIYDIILILIKLAGDEFRGKTNVHKNLYLIKEMLKNEFELPYRFKPYFYGPFSVEISNALDLLQSSGLLDSDERELGRDDMEMRLTVYRLTDSGEKAIEKARNSYPDFFQQLERHFNTIKGTGQHQNTRVLATAAKLKLIVSQEGKPLTIPMIQEKAQELGWEISDSDTQAAIDVLDRTGLVSVRGRRDGSA